jgi:hypothetical protein
MADARIINYNNSARMEVCGRQSAKNERGKKALQIPA